MAEQLTEIVDTNTSTNNNAPENSYQISEIDLDECENLEDDCLLEESSELPSISNGGRGPYERAWTTEATRALIHIRGPMEENFTEGRQKRTALWLYCTRQLQRMGFRYSAAKVQKKWHNILITYNKNLSKKYLSGYVHWEFFEEMFKYLQGKKADFEMQQQHQLHQQQIQELQQQQQLQDQNVQQPEMSKQQEEQIKQQPSDSQPYISHVDQKLFQTQLPLATKSTDDFDDDDDDSTTMSELRQPKIEYDEDAEQSPNLLLGQNVSAFEEQNSHQDIMPSMQDSQETVWWKDYFERKLQMDREKIDLQRSIHREQLQVNKMALMQQERIERLKIDAINSLTATLQKLVEIRNRKA